MFSILKRGSTQLINNDTPIVDLHILALDVLSATILFLLLRYNKNFATYNLKEAITIISLLFCVIAFFVSLFSFLASIIRHKDNKINKNISINESFSLNNILDKMPIITSVILLLISILLLYTVTSSSIKMYKKSQF